MKHRQKYGNTSVIPTSNYFFGMNTGEEIYVSIEPGKTLIIRYFTLSEPNEKDTEPFILSLMDSLVKLLLNTTQ